MRRVTLWAAALALLSSCIQPVSQSCGPDMPACEHQGQCRGIAASENGVSCPTEGPGYRDLADTHDSPTASPQSIYFYCIQGKRYYPYCVDPQAAGACPTQDCEQGKVCAWSQSQGQWLCIPEPGTGTNPCGASCDDPACTCGSGCLEFPDLAAAFCL